MFDVGLRRDAERILARLRAEALMVVTAESCTGGLIAALLTEVPGSSDVVERGYVTYSNEAKAECLGVPAEMIARYGAVSENVARAMADGALIQSNADLAISVTGIAGPGGDTPDKPVGLVHMALASNRAPTIHQRMQFGDIGRQGVRLETVKEALKLMARAIETR